MEVVLRISIKVSLAEVPPCRPVNKDQNMHITQASQSQELPGPRLANGPQAGLSEQY